MDPYADQNRMQAEQEAELEAFENWCELRGLSGSEVGAWEEFANDQVERAEQAAEDAAWARGCG